jgi:hypothetical protein
VTPRDTFGFIVPASLIVLAIAIVYGQLESLDWAISLLYGMSPVVIAVVVNTMVKLAPTACTDALTWAIGSFLVALVVLQPIAILVGPRWWRWSCAEGRTCWNVGAARPRWWRCPRVPARSWLARPSSVSAWWASSGRS